MIDDGDDDAWCCQNKEQEKKGDSILNNNSVYVSNADTTRNAAVVRKRTTAIYTEGGYNPLLGRVALGAQRPIVIKLSRVRSVGRSVCRSVGRSVCLSTALWKNGRSQPAAVRHHRSDGSMDEAGIGVWQSVHGKGYFWGRIWTAPL